ncbi:phage N-6-adenine-methyltransferase [Anaerohalosphaera lusitana]|uniref:Phage N-6-adenine-methyltransferase n=1 Tax=Anaerohalosphaera lusitana TaxID=1936003 RepID=A0A1U9NR20_9BACT|nr:DNA N-6-adenine-methyltransferase [Anaerohalosphaera lusitana]AQT70070.1 phage N-6-adenine-methyltransferase [Anaerohalosphaera lusitana]
MKSSGFSHDFKKNKTNEWYTPTYVFDSLGIKFDMDVASPGKDIVPWIPAKKHLTIRDDGLHSQWQGTVWCNPPYGRETSNWLEKMYEHNDGIALVFARIDTSWFYDYCRPANALLFLKGRVKFIRHDQASAYVQDGKVKNNGSGAGSMLVAYGERCERALFGASSRLGPVFRYVS